MLCVYGVYNKSQMKHHVIVVT